MLAEDLMRLAIDAARRGVANGQSPFGCAISMNGNVVAVAHNVVLLTTDVTAHAEVSALREACRAVGDVHLTNAEVATTCEPCPMCMAALHWARVRTVYYGATIADAAAGGFNELTLAAAEVLRLGKSDVRLVPGVLAGECRALFAEWKRTPGTRAY
ncbi:MAG TPA: nucleoside deaminase [Gemmatimonadaceae bacterium]|nr:nucleoside deaminase [Gemmatimonadaceae bacterium]